jgi:hypothetical protein
LELIYADHGKVIGSVTYVGRDDVWRAESVHQPGAPKVFHDPESAQDWVKQLHHEETSAE